MAKEKKDMSVREYYDMLVARVWENPEYLLEISSIDIDNVIKALRPTLHFPGESNNCDAALAHKRKRKLILDYAIRREDYSPYWALFRLYQGAKRKNLQLEVLKKVEEINFSLTKQYNGIVKRELLAPYPKDAEDIAEVLGNVDDDFDKKLYNRLRYLHQMGCLDNKYNAIIPKVYERPSGETIARKGGNFLEIWKFLLRYADGYDANRAWEQLAALTAPMSLKKKKKYDECFLAVAKKMDAMPSLSNLSASLMQKIEKIFN